MQNELNELEQYQTLGTVEELAELVEAKRGGRCVVLPKNWSIGMINCIMSLCERARAMRIAKGEEDSPIITWQLYNLLSRFTREKAQAAKEDNDERD